MVRMAKSRCSRIGLLLVGVLVLSVSANAGDWVWSNPQPDGNAMRGAAACGSTWVAVGEMGRLYSSNNGVDWIRRDSGTTENLAAVACGGGAFVVVGGGGTVLRSTDGVAWVPVVSGTSANLMNVKWFDGFVAVGWGPTILTSDDGLDWTTRYAEALPSSRYLWGLASSGSRLVATGGDWTDSTGANIVFSSLDGSSWGPVIAPEGMDYVVLNQAAYGAGLFVTVDDAGRAYSWDGASSAWTPSVANPAGGLSGVVWDGSRFVAVGAEGSVVTSPDGVSWTSLGSAAPSYLNDVTWTGAVLIASGQSRTLSTSDDGATWTPGLGVSGFFGVTLMSAAFNGSQLVATGYRYSPYEGVFAVSDDGMTWDAYPATWRPLSIAWGSGKYVATFGSDYLETSTDGAVWSAGTFGSGAPTLIKDITWDDVTSRFLAVGGVPAKVLRSPDAGAWEVIPTDTTTPYLYGVACGDCGCVSVGYNGVVVHGSAVGGSWSVVDHGLTVERLNAVASDGHSFVAVGVNGTVLVSSDGENWVDRSLPTTLALYDVAWVGDQFVASTWSHLYTSTDGQTWEDHLAAGEAIAFYGVAHGYPLAVGRDATIMVRCDYTVNTDGDMFGDLCDPCPSDPDNLCDAAESAAELVLPSGGALGTATGTATVVFPDGALAEPTAVSITSYDPMDADAGFVVGNGLVAKGNVYDFQPELEFDTSVEISLAYQQDEMAECGLEENALDVFWWNDGEWVSLGADQNCAANTLTFVTDHFSFYVVGQLDTDGDGVPDELDNCQQSYVEDTVIIDGCDTGVPNTLVEDGCTMTDLLMACAAQSSTHGLFVSCVADRTNKFEQQGIISGGEKGRIQSCAAHANLP